MKKSYELTAHLFLWALIVYLNYNVLVGMGYPGNMNNGIILLGIRFFGYWYLGFLIFSTLIGPFISFYLFYILYIPKLFLPRKMIHFIVLSLCSSFIIGFAFRLTFGGVEAGEFRRMITYTVFALMCGIIGGAFKGLFLWLDSVVEGKELEKKHLENKNALLLLKAQINPHFLFNSLNNIDILIEEQPKVASVYLRKLSDILRYVLHEANESEIELSKEIDQIKNYIELQKIRTTNLKFVNFIIKGDLSNKKVASMIFLPFIENAFKHSRNKAIENAIQIEFEIMEDTVKMKCLNHYDENQIGVIENEKLGLQTIKQRLNILYPRRHKLTITKDELWFQVILSIEL